MPANHGLTGFSGICTKMVRTLDAGRGPHHSKAECALCEHFTSQLAGDPYNSGYPLSGKSLMLNSPGNTDRSLENIMFAYVLEQLSNWFESAERNRREAYLASSTDIVELEHRLRNLEAHGYSL